MEIASNFLTEIIDADLAAGLNEQIHTRFPPEPNGYLHIGSAKAIYINWSIAKKYGGKFNLRFDDTNPVREDDEYVQSIQKDIVWLTGEEPNGGIYYGSDYFETCYECAVALIKAGKAFVCDLTQEELRAQRGTLTEPGKNSPYRDRSIEENLQLFEDMRAGKFPDGSKTLRAKIDMASPNMNMRDPAIYRIVRAHHHRQGDTWCIYPLYDFAHPIQDAIEGITHSMCSIEFENHRPLYEWVVDNCPLPHHPKQREFARLNVTNTVMSKRYLRQLVFEHHVEGWDDPRMPTLCGLRRRGYTPSAILDFVQRAGIAKANSLVDIRLLEHCIREELNRTALRRMAVTEPIKLTITNYPEDKTEYFEVITDENGEVTEVRCTADLETGNGMPADGRKVRGTIHWVSAATAVDASIYLYNDLFTLENTGDVPEGTNYLDYLNPDSLKKLEGCKLEPSITDVPAGTRMQFVRMGYFIKDEEPGRFNRIVTLKDSFAKTLNNKQKEARFRRFSHLNRASFHLFSGGLLRIAHGFVKECLYITSGRARAV